MTMTPKERSGDLKTNPSTNAARNNSIVLEISFQNVPWLPFLQMIYQELARPQWLWH